MEFVLSRILNLEKLTVKENGGGRLEEARLGKERTYVTLSTMNIKKGKLKSRVLLFYRRKGGFLSHDPEDPILM